MPRAADHAKLRCMHHPLRLCRALLTLLLAPVACSPAPVVDEAAPQSIEELRARIQRTLDQAHLPGVGFAIVQGGEITYVGGVGKADVARGREITGDTLFRTASITKSLIGLAMLKLREEGRMSLDATLVEVAPEIAMPNPWESTHPLRVAHLLEHTAGFDDNQISEMANTLARDAPLREVLAVCPASRVPRWPPGTRKAYSNPGYTVAAYLIEKITGRAYEDDIGETLLRPMGMTTASLRWTPQGLAALAQGYNSVGDPVPTVPTLHRPAGSLLASPRDLARLVQLFIRRGTVGDTALLTQASIERAERNETLRYPGYRELATQYGIGNFGYNLVGFVVHGHDGDNYGFSSLYGYDPQRQFGWAVLFNSNANEDSQDRIASLIAEFATRAIPKPTPAHVEIPAQALTELAGYYRLASPRREWLRLEDDLLGGRTITVEDGALYQQGIGLPRARLVPASPRLFRRIDQPAPTVLFTRAEDGRPAMIASDQYFERASPWPARLHLAVLLVALLLVSSSLGYALLLVVRALTSAGFRARAPLATYGAVVLPTLTVCAWAWMLGPATRSIMIAPKNPATEALFLLSLAYPAFAIAALVVSARTFVAGSATGRVARGYPLVTAVSNLVLCGYMLAWGFIGFRAWTQ